MRNPFRRWRSPRVTTTHKKVCWFGRHRPIGPNNIGVNPARPGWVHFYCPRCQDPLSTQPVMEQTNPETLEGVGVLQRAPLDCQRIMGGYLVVGSNV